MTIYKAVVLFDINWIRKKYDIAILTVRPASNAHCVH